MDRAIAFAFQPGEPRYHSLPHAERPADLWTGWVQDRKPADHWKGQWRHRADRFFARIYWTQGGRSSIGVYIGEISSSSWIFQGRTYDELATPAKITDFNSSQSTPFYCAPLPGYAEVVRRAVPAAQYQAEFDRFTKAGYRPIWVDGFRAEGQNWFNVIFRPEDGTPWVARHNLTSQQYQTDFDSLPKEGYRPLYIESYPTAEGTRYASIFVKADGPPWLAYHNRGPADHQANFNQRIAEGWVPTIISVTRAGGERRYRPELHL